MVIQWVESQIWTASTVINKSCWLQSILGMRMQCISFICSGTCSGRAAAFFCRTCGVGHAYYMSRALSSRHLQLHLTNVKGLIMQQKIAYYPLLSERYCNMHWSSIKVKWVRCWQRLLEQQLLKGCTDMWPDAPVPPPPSPSPFPPPPPPPTGGWCTTTLQPGWLSAREKNHILSNAV